MNSEILKRVEALRLNADLKLQDSKREIDVGRITFKAVQSIASSQLALLELEIWQLTQQDKMGLIPSKEERE